MPRKPPPADTDRSNYVPYSYSAGKRKSDVKEWISTVTGEIIKNRQYKEHVVTGGKFETLERKAERRKIEAEKIFPPAREIPNPKHPEWVDQEFLIKNRENQKWLRSLDRLPFVEQYIKDFIDPNALVWVIACGTVYKYGVNIPDPEDYEGQEESGSSEEGCRTIIEATQAKDVYREWNTPDHKLSQFVAIRSVRIMFRGYPPE